MHADTNVCVCVYVHACIHVCMHVCMYVCLDVCVYIYIYGGYWVESLSKLGAFIMFRVV